jgi:hypothetical protein
MFAGSQRPGSADSKTDYWLRRCEGFRVDSPDGRVGVVEEVRYVSRSDRPDVIVVRAGLFGRLRLLVPVGEIAKIVPDEERVALRRPPRRRRAEGVAAGFERLGAHREVKAVIDRLKHSIDARLRKGGEREKTPEEEASAQPSAEEPPAEEQAEEEPASEEAPAEGATEAAPAAEEAPAEEEPTV